MTLDEIIANGDTAEARKLARTMTQLQLIMAMAKASKARSDAVREEFNKAFEAQGPQYMGRVN